MSSENNWNPAWVGDDKLEWVTVPGTDVSLQIMKGWPLQVLRAFAADFNTYIEPLRDNDSACYTPTNSVSTSNHLNGTAMDLNWDSHAFHVKGTFNAAQMRTIRELLEFYEDTVFWAGDWNDPIDEMHWQMGYETFNNPAVGDFIRRKVRSDGFSTFRRGDTPVKPPSGNAAAILARAAGITLDRAVEVLPAVSAGLKAAECTNILREAMWFAQVVHENDDFNATEEYASGADYEGRDDLGNTQPGDGIRFKGRSWIQITGRHNYGKFSEWAYSKGLVPTPTYFVDNPEELAELKWAGIGAAWYWIVARPDINTLSDNRDLETVTRRINGGLHGLEDRRNRYNRALAVGDDLLQLINIEGDDEVTPELAQMIRDIHAALYSDGDSLCWYAPKDDRRWKVFELIKNTDGGFWDFRIEELARGGDAWALSLIADAASGEARNTDKRVINRATVVLNEIATEHPEYLKAA